jgi:2-hydroxychromene-2-carboxylate isomerase
VKFYFSLRSPYSWLALHDLTHHYPDVADAVQWRPFWEPDEAGLAQLAQAGGSFPYTPMSREKHMYVLQDVRRLAQDRGLTVAWPIDRAPVWEVAHLPYLLAERAGVGREYVEAVSRARWQRGLDINDPEVIAELAASVGLDAAAARVAAKDEKLRELGAQKQLDVYRDGVFGVPFFVAGREKFWGIDRLPAFVAKVRESVLRESAPQESVPRESALSVAAASFDDGHAGGCG